MNRRYIGVICSFKALRAPAHFRSVMRLIRKRPVNVHRTLTPIRWKPRSKRRSNGTPGSKTVPTSHTTILCSTASIRNLDAGRLVRDGPILLLDLVSDIRETATRVAEREVVNPAANYGINRFNQPFYQLRAGAPDNLFELTKTRESFTVLSHLVGTKKVRA